MYQIYKVESNETIEMIASKVGIPVSELKRINGIGDNSNIIGGNYIIVPSMSNMIDDYQTYTVKQGDTMYSIAKEKNTDIDTLFSLNGLNKNDYIYPNQDIVIPNRNIYITKENDTIKDIVTKFNIDLEKIGNLYIVSDQIIKY